MNNIKVTLNIPKWLYNYFEIGWQRSKKGAEWAFSVPSEKSFNNLEDYIVYIIGELVKVEDERFKKKMREHIPLISETIDRTLKKILEKESENKKY